MTHTVLFVDDDPSNLTVFDAAFGDEFTVITAASGAEALSLLATIEVAVLLADQRMPGMSGVELMARARQDHPAPVRLLITAYSNLDEAIQAINQGHIRRYLRKPWNHDELRAALLDAIEVYSVRQRLAAMERRMMDSERVYALGVVAAGIAHEMRNPMTVVMGQLDLARGHTQRLVAAEAGAGVADLQKLSGRLASLHDAVVRVREIMEGMSLAHRRQDAQRQSDLAEVVRLTTTSLRGSLQHRAQTVVELDTLPPVRGSTTQLGQVALNLLVNALQAIPEDQAGPDQKVGIRLWADGADAVLQVEDSGPGMSPDVAARIFDPFFTTKTAGGTGLGLAITRRIVEELGGSVMVQSTPGLGTCFTVRIPFAGGEPFRQRGPSVG